MKKLSKEKKEDLIVKLILFLRGLTFKEIDEILTGVRKLLKFKKLEEQKKNLANTLNKMDH